LFVSLPDTKSLSLDIDISKIFNSAHDSEKDMQKPAFTDNDHNVQHAQDDNFEPSPPSLTTDDASVNVSSTYDVKSSQSEQNKQAESTVNKEKRNTDDKNGVKAYVESKRESVEAQNAQKNAGGGDSAKSDNARSSDKESGRPNVVEKSTQTSNEENNNSAKLSELDYVNLPITNSYDFPIRKELDRIDQLIDKVKLFSHLLL